MTGPEHYATAEQLLVMAEDFPASIDAEDAYAHEHYLISKAQVHATLALAAATAAAKAPDPQINVDWYRAGAW